MLSCVEIFKSHVLQLTLRYFVPRAPLLVLQICVLVLNTVLTAFITDDNMIFLRFFFWCFMAVWQTNEIGALPPPTDLKCGVYIDLEEKNKQKK